MKYSLISSPAYDPPPVIQLISGHTTDLLNFGMISEGLILVAFFVLNIIFEFDLCLIKKPSFPSTGSQETEQN